MNLYHTNQLAQLSNFIDQDTGEIDMVAFDAMQVSLREKQIAVIAYLKNKEVSLNMLDDAIKQLQARKKSEQNRLDNLTKYLYDNMKANGITEIESQDLVFSAKIKKNPHKLIIDDAGKIPCDLYIYHDAPPPSPDNAKIKELLKAGQHIDGCRLEQGERLELK